MLCCHCIFQCSDFFSSFRLWQALGWSLARSLPLNDSLDSEKSKRVNAKYAVREFVNKSAASAASLDGFSSRDQVGC